MIEPEVCGIPALGLLLGFLYISRRHRKTLALLGTLLV